MIKILGANHFVPVIREMTDFETTVVSFPKISAIQVEAPFFEHFQYLNN